MRNEAILPLPLLLLLPLLGYGQTYTSYFTGNGTDLVTDPGGGTCLMGGATEHDQAMRWWLQRAEGGDILVLRTSGADGYNDYLYAALGVPVNSVETIVCHDPAAGYDPYVQERIRRAEAIWFAGGNQWDYVSYWRGTPVDSLVNEAVRSRHAAIGGTSAGMAVLSRYYFSAQNGTITSAEALSDPFHPSLTVDTAAFLSAAYLEDVLADTHFDNPDRRGRLTAFLARLFTLTGQPVSGIACDEYTAVCISPDGHATVYGDYPAYDDNAYFVSPHCGLPQPVPESCSPGVPLTWNLQAEALDVCQVKGTANGDFSFDLSDWETTVGGSWLHWWAEDGFLFSAAATPPDCLPSAADPTAPQPDGFLSVHPNPGSGRFRVSVSNGLLEADARIEVLNPLGQAVPVSVLRNGSQLTFQAVGVGAGLYFLSVQDKRGRRSCPFVLLAE
ncbi:MAG: Cyanophycinase [Bacteroidota bacterium]